MARKPRGLSPEDEAVWADVTRTVRPLRRRMILAPKPVAPQLDEAPPPNMGDAPAASPGRPLPRPRAPVEPRVTITWAQNGPAPADRGGERKVRRGQVEIDAVLDLHGFTQDQAFSALTHFLYQAQARGAGAVLIVTGKGGARIDGESAPGVLRRRLPGWLAAPGLAPIVTGMAGAHRRHGGAGAAYVFLRRLRPMDAGD